MRTLIVVPRYVNSSGKYYEFPLGLAYISSVLKSEGHEVTCLNLNNHGGTADAIIRREVKKNGIDMLCSGGLSVHYTKIRDILDAARSVRKDIITILGGGIVSSDPSIIMETLRPTFGVIGEGEETIAELARAMDQGAGYRNIHGITFFDNGSLITTSQRLPIEDIDSIPYPDYDGFGIGDYLEMQMPSDEYYMYHVDVPRVIPLIASRSCPYSCTFCYHPLGKKYRQRSLNAFFKELEYLVEKYDVNTISVVDELFSRDKKRIQEFCERIQKFDLKWLAQMRVDSVDKDTLGLLKESGCCAISYGLESASNEVLDSMKKHISVARMEETLKLTYNAGIGIQGNFIFGDKAETWRTACETLEWWERNRKYQINLTPIYLYPGTEIYRHALEKHVVTDPIRFLESGCPPVNIASMDNAEYSRMLSRIYQARIDNPIPAKVLCCVKTGSDLHKGDFYAVEVLCPHCGVSINYKNLHQNCNKMFPMGCRIGCRNCNQRFDLMPFKFYEYIQKNDAVGNKRLDSFESSRTIAVYGAGIAGNTVYNFLTEKGKEVLYFIDDFKEGQLCGLTIIKPAGVKQYPRPDLTVFAVQSPEYLPELIKKMKEWDNTPTFLYALSIPPDVLSLSDEESMLAYYLEYYLNRWLPLLESGLHATV